MKIEEQVMGDEAAWNQYAQEVAQTLLADERAALHRVARNDSVSDAALLARSLGHNDLADKWACVYCGEEVPDGVPHPNAFSCCGEVGHVEVVK